MAGGIAIEKRSQIMGHDNDDSRESENLIYAVAEIDNLHITPVGWNSQDQSTGYARLLLDRETYEIVHMEMVVDGMTVSESDNQLQTFQTNPVQPFHIHNLPQPTPDTPNPNFIVEQLFDWDSNGAVATATLEDTATGFRFETENYELRTPVNNASLTLDFVVQEILDGNAYIGIHTDQLPVPHTSIAGEVVVLSNGDVDGKMEWLGDDNDVAVGGRWSDLLSLGGGDDLALGLKGDDIIDCGAGDDRAKGGRGDDTIWSGDGDDLAHGGRGDDCLFGNRGNDKLFGNSGNDKIDGGLGEDLIIGGTGDDVMTGGLDADIFRFRLHSGNDTITDYVAGEDTLQFAGAQQVLSASLADLDNDGFADDTSLQLVGGQVSVLDVDLTADYLI